MNNGARETISLPDGTTVCLNSGSYVFYPENLEGKTRTVYLMGEAEFKVAKIRRNLSLCDHQIWQ